MPVLNKKDHVSYGLGHLSSQGNLGWALSYHLWKEIQLFNASNPEQGCQFSRNIKCWFKPGKNL